MNPGLADLDPLVIAATLAKAGRRRLAGAVHVFPRLASTMDRARELAEAGAPAGTTVVADEQAAGRGRLGRTWTAPPGTSLLFTVLFRPPSGVPLVQVPMALALGTLEAIRAAIPVRAQTGDTQAASLALKWPNDFVARQGRELFKLGGLIAEVLPGVEGDRGTGVDIDAGVDPGAGGAVPHSPAVLVGVGLNVRQREAELPPGATSLVRLGVAVADRGVLLARILAAAERQYATLLDGADLVPRWSRELATIRRVVTVAMPSGEVRGLAVGVAEDGALLVRDEAGTVHTVRAGDVAMAVAETEADRMNQDASNGRLSVGADN